MQSNSYTLECGHTVIIWADYPRTAKGWDRLGRTKNATKRCRYECGDIAQTVLENS